MKNLLLVLLTLCVISASCDKSNGSKEQDFDDQGEQDHDRRKDSDKSGIKQVFLSTGDYGMCSIDSKQHPTCWHPPGTGYAKKTNAELSGTFVALSGRGKNMCAITSAGKVLCFTPAEPTTKDPTALAGLGTFTAVAAADEYFCAIATSGELSCYKLDFSTSVAKDDYTATEDIEHMAMGTFISGGTSKGFNCVIAKSGTLACFHVDDANDAAKASEEGSKLATKEFNYLSLAVLSVDKKTIKSFGLNRKIKQDHVINFAEKYGDFAVFNNVFCGLLTSNNQVRCGAIAPAGLPEKNVNGLQKLILSRIAIGDSYFCGKNLDDIVSCFRMKDYPTEIPKAIAAE